VQSAVHVHNSQADIDYYTNKHKNAYVGPHLESLRKRRSEMNDSKLSIAHRLQYGVVGSNMVIPVVAMAVAGLVDRFD
jgi:hypothetical protein